MLLFSTDEGDTRTDGGTEPTRISKQKVNK